MSCKDDNGVEGMEENEDIGVETVEAVDEIEVDEVEVDEMEE